jgi:hypothetical protein
MFERKQLIPEKKGDSKNVKYCILVYHIHSIERQKMNEDFFLVLVCGKGDTL